jgi:hypothetical protein
VISTQVPARLDRLPWSAFHWRVVLPWGVPAERGPLEDVAPPFGTDTP